MAATLSKEVREVQNPALGAMLQWRFVVGYTGARPDAAGCPLILVFLVLPALFHNETLNFLSATRRGSGLRAFATKFTTEANSASDKLLGFHDRAALLKALSLDALRAAVAARLVAVDVLEGTAFPLTTTTPKVGLTDRIRNLARGAEKLGRWCGDLTLIEISSILHVRF